VCLQLATMAAEAAAKAAAALACGDAAGARQLPQNMTAALSHHHLTPLCSWLAGIADAEQQFVSWLEADGQLVAASISYPRAGSKDGLPCPHLYVELCCCNQPGQGFGSQLLCYLEAFLSTNALALSALLWRKQAVGAAAAATSGDSGGQEAAWVIRAAGAAGSSADEAATAAPAPAPLACIRLLSVESAQSFYCKHGYSEASCHEMSKAIPPAPGGPWHLRAGVLTGSTV
jgi:hypothetical protein